MAWYTFTHLSGVTLIKLTGWMDINEPRLLHFPLFLISTISMSDGFRMKLWKREKKRDTQKLTFEGTLLLSWIGQCWCSCARQVVTVTVLHRSSKIQQVEEEKSIWICWNWSGDWQNEFDPGDLFAFGWLLLKRESTFVISTFFEMGTYPSGEKMFFPFILFDSTSISFSYKTLSS